MIKRFVIAIVLLGLVAGGLVGFNLFRDRMIAQFLADMPVQPLPVEIVEADGITWQPSLGAIGTVNAAQGVELTVEVAGIVRTPAVTERFQQLGAFPVGGTPEEMDRFLRAEVARWAEVVKRSGARAD